MKSSSLTNKDGEVPELTAEKIRNMRPAKDVLPSTLLSVLPKRKRGERGSQRHPTKIAITLRYSPEVVDYFKATGSGWQTRMDKALKEWILNHPHAA